MRVLLLLALLFFAPPALAQPAPLRAEQVAERAVRDYAIAYFGAFSHLASDHEVLIASLCRGPQQGLLNYVRGHFRRLVGGYARVSFLRFGPLATDNRNERLFLWPDRKGIVLKQVQEALANEDGTATEWQSLQQKSVALQGLAALEFVLFGTGSETLATGGADSYRCRYAHAIAGAIRNVAQEAAAEWRAPTGIARRLIAPGLTDPDYRSTREVLEEFVGALAHGSEAVRDTYLLPFLGRETGDAPKPRSAPLWRSNATLTLTTEALLGIIDFARLSRIAEPAGEQGAYLAGLIAEEANNIRETAAEITGTVEEAAADRRQMQAWRYLVIYTQQLQSLIGEQLAAALNLSVGFSSLDGD